MEMNTSLIGDTRFTWLGWERSANNPTLGTGIHHPRGDVMKISFDSNQIKETANGSANSGYSHWFVTIDNGTLEKGSSGSPLFNQNKRVVGQLHSGYPGCSSSKNFWYGCFHHSWTGGGTNTTRLSNWLDPENTGVMTMNTARYPTISGPSAVCFGSTATFTVDYPVPNHTWHSSPNLRLNSVSGNSADFTSLFFGAEAWVGINVGGIQVARKDLIFGSLITGPDNISFTGKTGYNAEPGCSDSADNKWILTWSNLTSETEKPDTVYGKNHVVVVAHADPGNMAAYSLYIVQANENRYLKHIDARNVKLRLEGIRPIDPFPPLTILVSPNPATTAVTIQLQESTGETTTDQTFHTQSTNMPFSSGVVEIQLWSATSLLRKFTTDQDSYQFSVTDLPRGIYFVRVIKDGKTHTQKLIKN